MPAERAGLRYGDAIVAVDGESTTDWTQSDALKHVRGERGTPVEITVERAGVAEPAKLQIVRDEVPYPSVRNLFHAAPRRRLHRVDGRVQSDDERGVARLDRGAQAQGHDFD